MTDSMTPGAPYSEQILRYYNDTSEWEYFFREWDPNNKNLFAKTNRTLRSYATCEAYDIFKGQDGTSTDVTYYNHTEKKTRTLPNIMVRTFPQSILHFSQY